MKRLSTKLLVLSIIAVLTLSFTCIGAFASTTIPLKDGVSLVTYSDNEILPFLRTRSAVSFNFTMSIPLYEASGLVPTPYTYSGVSNVIPVDSPFSNIGFAFTKLPTNLMYFSLYDVNTNTYLTSGTNGLQGPSYLSKNFTFNGLTAGHNYMVRFSSTVSGTSCAGNVSTY